MVGPGLLWCGISLGMFFGCSICSMNVFRPLTFRDEGRFSCHPIFPSFSQRLSANEPECGVECLAWQKWENSKALQRSWHEGQWDEGSDDVYEAV